MKALTLTQPWASLVARGHKRIETRSWPTKFRGRIAIHAAKGWTAGERAFCDLYPFRDCLAGEKDPAPRGVIVAAASIWICLRVDLVRYTRAQMLHQLEATPFEAHFGNYSEGRWLWGLRDVKRVMEPIACKGALGLWTVPEDIESELRARGLA